MDSADQRSVRVGPAEGKETTRRCTRRDSPGIQNGHSTSARSNFLSTILSWALPIFIFYWPPLGRSACLRIRRIFPRRPLWPVCLCPKNYFSCGKPCRHSRRGFVTCGLSDYFGRKTMFIWKMIIFCAFLALLIRVEVAVARDHRLQTSQRPIPQPII